MLFLLDYFNYIIYFIPFYIKYIDPLIIIGLTYYMSIKLFLLLCLIYVYTFLIYILNIYIDFFTESTFILLIFSLKEFEFYYYDIYKSYIALVRRRWRVYRYKRFRFCLTLVWWSTGIPLFFYGVIIAMCILQMSFTFFLKQFLKISYPLIFRISPKLANSFYLGLQSFFFFFIKRPLNYLLYIFSFPFFHSFLIYKIYIYGGDFDWTLLKFLKWLYAHFCCFYGRTASVFWHIKEIRPIFMLRLFIKFLYKTTFRYIKYFYSHWKRVIYRLIYCYIYFFKNRRTIINTYYYSLFWFYRNLVYIGLNIYFFLRIIFISLKQELVLILYKYIKLNFLLFLKKYIYTFIYIFFYIYNYLVYSIFLFFFYCYERPLAVYQRFFYFFCDKIELFIFYFIPFYYYYLLYFIFFLF